MDEVLRHAVLPFLCENQWQYQSSDDNARTHLTRISKMSLVRAMLWACSSDMCAIWTSLWHFWTEDSKHNNGVKKHPASRCSVTGDIEADPSAPNHQNYSEYAKLVLVLLCRWLGTHSLLKAFSSSKCITLISCDIQRHYISIFKKNLHVIHVFM